MSDIERPRLTVIPGGKPDPSRYPQLAPAEKVALLARLPYRRQFDLLLDDPEGERILQALPPLQFYQLLLETGFPDAAPLFAWASTPQLLACLDLELWDGWELDRDKACYWLELLLALGERRALEVLGELDPELLILLVKGEVVVGGGNSDLVTDEERLADWDHSFDDVYFLMFRHRETADLFGQLLDLLYRCDQNRYREVLEGVKGEVSGELEELALRFRAGRLADLGIPEREQALEVYVPLPPERFVAAEHKQAVADSAPPALPVPAGERGSLLERALARASDPELATELQALLSAVLVADNIPFTDRAGIAVCGERVQGWLNLALEHLAGQDEALAVALLERETLKRLFRLAVGLLAPLRRQAAQQLARQTGLGHAATQALQGFREERPRFYRGLDPERRDDFREFASLADLRLAEEFLARLG